MDSLDKIKYVLNGETRYYTKEELREYQRQLSTKNNISCGSEQELDEWIDKLIERLIKYDGDPHGNAPDYAHDYLHELEAAGGILIVR
jgi:hypothetical protein